MDEFEDIEIPPVSEEDLKKLKAEYEADKLAVEQKKWTIFLDDNFVFTFLMLLDVMICCMFWIRAPDAQQQQGF